MGTVTYRHSVNFPLPEVWDWHTRPGAVVRLTPTHSRMKLVEQADNLRDGTTVFALPGKLTWRADHQPQDYVPNEQFGDLCTTTGLKQLTGWHHLHHFAAEGNATTVTDTLTTRAPGGLAAHLLAGMFNYRHNQLHADLTHLRHAAQWSAHRAPRTVAVTGADGLVGTQLCALLTTAGHTVIKLSRSARSTTGTRRKWDPHNPAPNLLEGVDSVIHLAGEPIAGRFTDKHIRAVRDSRVEPTRLLAELAARTEGIDTFVCSSAVGLYGNSRSQPADETAPTGGGDIAQIVEDWEAATEPARAAGLRVSNIRSGLVLAGGSPLLSLLRANVLLGGGRLGPGTQHFAWIGVDDAADIYHRALLDPKLSGPINAVAPQTVTNAEFTEILADVGGGWPTIPIPAAAPALVFGQRGAQELALADQNVVPAALQAMEHPFRHPDLASALRHELCKE